MSNSIPELILQGLTALDGNYDDNSLQTVSNMVSDCLQKRANSSGNVIWKPGYDISDSGDSLIICLDVPGVEADSININVDDHFLDITGERKKPFEAASRCCGVVYGEFEQRIKMPVSVMDPKRAKVSLNNGVLRITIDKTIEKRTKFSLPISTPSDE